MNRKKETNINNFKNKIFKKDVFELLKQMPDNSIDMIYADPDYGVGISYSGTRYITKSNEYNIWYGKLVTECYRVLKPTGNIFLINYPRQNAFVWANHLHTLAHRVKEYVWIYNSNTGHNKNSFTTAHRSILHVTKSKHNRFYKEAIAQPYCNPEDKRVQRQVQRGSKGRMPYSFIYANLVRYGNKDKTEHPCQIPLSLTELLIKASTQEQDTCFILFGGSGNELKLCRKLERNFISCETLPAYFILIEEVLGKRL